MATSIVPLPARRVSAGPPTVEVFLLGQIDFRHCLALQKRLIYDAHTRADGQISLLLCEHSPVITIGRGGSPDDVEPRGVQLASRQVDIFRVNRGGGTILHLPGDLAVYAVCPLDWHGWSVGEFLDRFQRGLLAALEGVGVRGLVRSPRHGVWGRSGQLVSLGVAVRDWITYFGAQIYIVPPLQLVRYLKTDQVDHTPIGSLSSELGHPLTMSRLRSRVVRALAESFGCDEYHAYTGHPLLSHVATKHRETALAS